MKRLVSAFLAGAMALSLAACGEQKDNTDAPDDADTPAEITYAVEAGSAGEEVALANGFKTVPVGSQANALMEVDAGTADAAIIDLLMAGAMVGENTSYPDLKVTDQKLNSELYGVGCRKGSDLASFINSVMADAYADGTMVELAKTSTYTRIFDVNAARFSAPQDMRAEIRTALAETGEAPATDADLINSIYHSLAYCYGEAFRELEALTGQHWDKLYIAGGGAKNATLNELTAHYTGKQVVALPIEATAIGNLKIQMSISEGGTV